MRAARTAFVLTLLAAGPAFAQGEGDPLSPTATEADYAAVVKKAVESYIVPAYGRLEAATHDLVSEVEGYCLGPDPETRKALTASFARTIEVWAGVDFFRFGPMAREGRYERFAFWPDVHNTGARQLRRFLAVEDSALLDPVALAEQSAAVQGLPALESLIYSGSKALASTSDAPDDYRCRLAMAVSANIDRIASDARDGWSGRGSWASLMLEPGVENPVYRTSKEAMTEVLKAILTGLEQMRDHRLHPAVGDTPDKARASRAPYDRAGEALAYLRASAGAIEAFVDASGIVSLAPTEKSWIAESAAFEFANLKNALDGVGSDFEAALTEPEKRQMLVYAEIVLKSLRDLFQRQFGPSAGLTQGFNSLDGD